MHCRDPASEPPQGKRTHRQKLFAGNHFSIRKTKWLSDDLAKTAKAVLEDMGITNDLRAPFEKTRPPAPVINIRPEHDDEPHQVNDHINEMLASGDWVIGFSDGAVFTPYSQNDEEPQLPIILAAHVIIGPHGILEANVHIVGLSPAAYDAEVNALTRLAKRILIYKRRFNCKAAMYTDCQSALKMILGVSEDIGPSERTLIEALRHFGTSDILQWVNSHVGIKGNEVVDSMCSQVIERWLQIHWREAQVTLPRLPVSHAAVKSLLKKKLEQEEEAMTTGDIMIVKQKSISSAGWKQLGLSREHIKKSLKHLRGLQFGREVQKYYLQIISGCMSREFGTRLKCCGTEKTPVHILFECQLDQCVYARSLVASIHEREQDFTLEEVYNGKAPYYIAELAWAAMLHFREVTHAAIQKHQQPPSDQLLQSCEQSMVQQAIEADLLESLEQAALMSPQETNSPAL